MLYFVISRTSMYSVVCNYSNMQEDIDDIHLEYHDGHSTGPGDVLPTVEPQTPNQIPNNHPYLFTPYIVPFGTSTGAVYWYFSRYRIILRVSDCHWQCTSHSNDPPGCTSKRAWWSHKSKLNGVFKFHHSSCYSSQTRTRRDLSCERGQKNQ